jgi:hypothetical protein
MSYRRTVTELREAASIFWPAELSRKAFEQSVIPLLLETQDQFIAILSVPVRDISGLFDVINISTFPPNLFLKHLVVLTDFGGEMLQRINQFYDVLFPTGAMEYRWGDARGVYRFKALPVRGVLNNAHLHIDSSALLSKVAMSNLSQDVIALLVVGGACTDARAAAVLEKCVIGRYLGDPGRLANYIKQRYIWVSRITGGSDANTLGQLAERTVIKYLEEHLNVPGATIQVGGSLPGVTHRDDRSRSQKPTAFDIVVARGNKHVGIEVSFQVTTNSVIERKGREALAVFRQVEEAGHRIAYVIDGAGNFQRQAAVENLCTYSHCTIAFSPDEFRVLCAFVREFLQE